MTNTKAITDTKLFELIGEADPLSMDGLRTDIGTEAAFRSLLESGPPVDVLPVPNRRYPRRAVLRVGLVAATAAAIVAATVFGVSAHSRDAHVRAVASTPRRGLRALEHPTAARVLRRAAFVALQTKTVTPSGDQFVYTKTETGNGQITQSWSSVDGTRDSAIQTGSTSPRETTRGCINGHTSFRMPGRDGKPLAELIPKKFRGTPISAGRAAKLFFGGRIPMDGPIVTGPCTPQPAYLPGLPTTASGMLPYLEKTQGVRLTNLNDLAKTAGYLLQADYLLPAQQAAVYDFLARTPGITVRTGITDVAGRPAVGVVWSDGSQSMLMFNPRTYTYLGWTTTGINGQTSGTALLAEGIVDSVGQAPQADATTDGA